MKFMEYYKEKHISNSPLHKQPHQLVSMKKELRVQACYIDYIHTLGDLDCKDFIMRPVPKGVGKLMLSIVRNKSGFNKWYPKYTLVAYIDPGDNTAIEIELLVGKKRSKNSKPTYLISLDIKNPKSKGDAYCGKVKMTNKKSKSYCVFDDGLNPKKDRKPNWRRTLAEMSFKSMKMDKLGTIR